MVSAFRVALLVLSFLLCVTVAGVGEPAKPQQIVLISFDGAHALAQWERSRDLARRTNARFTYFLSCVYLLSPSTSHYYRTPGGQRAKSNVGFAQSRQEVAGRLRQIWAARREGHEIASHGCGHFDGKGWRTRDRTAEHASFTDILKNAWAINRIAYEPRDWRQFADQEIIGFRAPYLSTNPAMFKALEVYGFRYDASGVTRGPARPQLSDRLVRFSLPTIPEGPRNRRIIAMDYNLYVRHSGGLERPGDADQFADRTVTALMGAFNREYDGPRRPLSIGFHFTLMNGGAYWDALERFATEVCRLPEVACISHRDYLTQSEPGALDG